VYLSLQKTDTSAAWPRLPTSLLVRATPFFFHLRRQKIGQNFAFRNHPKQKHLHMYLHTDLESFLFKFGCRCDPSASQYLPIVRHSTYQLCVTVPINCASQYQPIVRHSTYQLCVTVLTNCASQYLSIVRQSTNQLCVTVPTKKN
jgi:hypothetical protein